jgi:hypothetical protein
MIFSYLILLAVLSEKTIALSLEAAKRANVAAAAPPAQFTPYPSVGGGGTKYKDSPHFRVYNADDPSADSAIKSLEAAYACFVDGQGWRSTGLSYRSQTDDGPFYKMNIYSVTSLPGASANMGSDMSVGYSFLNVVTRYLSTPAVTVHEYGHALTYHAQSWVEQVRTGAWWETTAEFVADTYLTSAACSTARARYNQPEGNTIVDLKKVIGDSYQVIVDGTTRTANHYQAWPFLSYLWYNPDNYTGLGSTVFPGVWTKYKRGSNETPLHVLARLAESVPMQQIVGRYWARMAFADIGHPKLKQALASVDRSLNFQNLDSLGGTKYRVKSSRQPRYMGANIIPLKGTGTINITITSSMKFTATASMKSASGSVRYQEIGKETSKLDVATGEEVRLAIVNTPDTLYMYDPFSLSSEVSRGLDYDLDILGATI